MKWYLSTRPKSLAILLAAISVLAFANLKGHETRVSSEHGPSNELPSGSAPPSAFVPAQLSGGLPLSNDDSQQLGMEKMAEMTAMFRHNDDCPSVPPAWSSAFVMLMMTHPPSEAQVEAKERETLALRDKIGKPKWCQLYAVEMQEAYTIFQFAIQR